MLCFILYYIILYYIILYYIILYYIILYYIILLHWRYAVHVITQHDTKHPKLVALYVQYWKKLFKYNKRYRSRIDVTQRPESDRLSHMWVVEDEQLLSVTLLLVSNWTCVKFLQSASQVITGTLPSPVHHRYTTGTPPVKGSLERMKSFIAKFCHWVVLQHHSKIHKSSIGDEAYRRTCCLMSAHWRE